MKIVLPKERPISWNKFYTGTHYIVRKTKAADIHDLIGYSLMEMGIKRNGKSFFEKRVDIRVTVFFDRSPFDSDNIPAKFYIDGLKGILLKEDNYERVRDVTTRSDIDEKNPRVEIEITEVNE